MSLICSKCGRDLNEIWQDNMSSVPGLVLCEDCSGFTARSKFERQCWAEYERYLSQEFEAYIKKESPCRKGGGRVKHYGDVSKINGAEVEPVPIAATKSRFGRKAGVL